MPTAEEMAMVEMNMALTWSLFSSWRSNTMGARVALVSVVTTGARVVTCTGVAKGARVVTGTEGQQYDLRDGDISYNAHASDPDSNLMAFSM